MPWNTQLLAQASMRIHEVYQLFGQQGPARLFEPVFTNYVVEAFKALSRATCEEATLMRLRGIRWMGYVLGIVFVMFPHSIDAGPNVVRQYFTRGAGPAVSENDTMLVSSQWHVDSRLVDGHFIRNGRCYHEIRSMCDKPE